MFSLSSIHLVLQLFLHFFMNADRQKERRTEPCLPYSAVSLLPIRLFLASGEWCSLFHLWEQDRELNAIEKSSINTLGLPPNFFSSAFRAQRLCSFNDREITTPLLRQVRLPLRHRRFQLFQVLRCFIRLMLKTFRFALGYYDGAWIASKNLYSLRVCSRSVGPTIKMFSVSHRPKNNRDAFY